MSGFKRSRWGALLVFELMPSLKGPLIWAALGGLALLMLPLRFLSTGEFSLNGQLIGQGIGNGAGQDFRLVYVVGAGYSAIVFLTTLLTLCLCLDRTGPHYLRNNDLLALSRPMGRPAFYLVKMASAFLPGVVYSLLAIGLFWEELYRNAGVNLYRVFLLAFPLALAMACLVSLYFLMRNFLGNFMIFFLSLLLLPVIYVGNLWRYYAGAFREGMSQTPALGWLPQFGGIHAYSLGMVHDSFFRPDTWMALVNASLWTVGASLAGLWLFGRKRL